MTKTFVAEYPGPDGMYVSEIEAVDWQHAQQICDERGKGEVVYGELVLKVSGDHMTHEKADAMCKAFAENGTIPD